MFCPHCHVELRKVQENILPPDHAMTPEAQLETLEETYRAGHITLVKYQEIKQSILTKGFYKEKKPEEEKPCERCGSTEFVTYPDGSVACLQCGKILNR